MQNGLYLNKRNYKQTLIVLKVSFQMPVKTEFEQAKGCTFYANCFCSCKKEIYTVQMRDCRACKVQRMLNTPCVPAVWCALVFGRLRAVVIGSSCHDEPIRETKKIFGQHVTLYKDRILSPRNQQNSLGCTGKISRSHPSGHRRIRNGLVSSLLLRK